MNLRCQKNVVMKINQMLDVKNRFLQIPENLPAEVIIEIMSTSHQ